MSSRFWERRRATRAGEEAERKRREEFERRKFDAEEFHRVRASRWQKVAAVAAASAAATAVVFGTIALLSGDRREVERPSGGSGGLPIATGTPTSTPSATPTPDRGIQPAAGSDIDLGCPAPSGPRGRSLVRIRVVGWCAIPGVRRQAQLKVKLRVTNGGHRSLDIRRERFRVLVRKLHGRWTPPRISSASTSERPIKVSYGGRPLWAIPANVDGAYDELPDEPGIGTFATHWKAQELPARSSFRPPLSNRSDGVLVFYVPVVEAGSARIADVVGVALMRGRRPLAVCPPQQWGDRLGATEF